MISFRDVTDLEPITSIPDNADIVVVVDGVAKRISKENAKFGGGAVEKKVFYVGVEKAAEQDANVVQPAGMPATGYTLYKDIEFTTLATAQEVFDAWDEGSLMLQITSGSSPTFANWDMFGWQSGNTFLGDTSQVSYVLMIVNSNRVQVGVLSSGK